MNKVEENTGGRQILLPTLFSRRVHNVKKSKKWIIHSGPVSSSSWSGERKQTHLYTLFDHRHILQAKGCAAPRHITTFCRKLLCIFQGPREKENRGMLFFFCFFPLDFYIMLLQKPTFIGVFFSRRKKRNKLSISSLRYWCCTYSFRAVKTVSTAGQLWSAQSALSQLPLRTCEGTPTVSIID